MIFKKEDLKVNDTQISVLAGILNVCALVGSLASGRTSDFLGRRYTIVLASIMFLVGSVLMGYAPNYPILLTGRCTAGVGVGYALMIAPVYSAEISPPNQRLYHLPTGAWHQYRNINWLPHKLLHGRTASKTRLAADARYRGRPLTRLGHRHSQNA